jgi:hypothetical protein
MRTMLKIRMPAEPANRMIENGALGKLLEATMSRLKPEASYFFADKGCRCAMIVFDMQDSSQIPVICEPLFMQLNAEIEMQPVMNGEDLAKGLKAAVAK